MKPKIVIKKVKGHQYLQVLDMYGHLIHIGNTDSLENWAVALEGLQNSYDGLALQEALKLDRERVTEMVLKFKGKPPDNAWKEFARKRIQRRIDREFILKLLDHIPEDQILQDLTDLRINLEAIEEYSKSLQLSPEFYELAKPILEKRNADLEKTSKS